MEGRTPKSRIRGELRRLFVRSSERASAIKRDAYTCQKCGIKASKAKGREVKLDVHHLNGIDIWDEVITLIQDKILCDPVHLQTLCRDCHKQVTHEEQNGSRTPDN